jgi:tetratricopeptide (TPR) repeat protein
VVRGLLHAVCNENQEARADLFKGLKLAEEPKDTLQQVCNDIIEYVPQENAYSLLEAISHEYILPSWVLESIIEHYTQKDLLAQAAAIAQRHVDEEPYNVGYWHCLGQVYRSLGLYEKALWAFEYALLIDEEDFSSQVSRFETFYQAERFEEAYEAFQPLREILESETVFRNLYAWTAYETGNYEEARNLYRDTVHEEPDNSEAWYGLGLVYLEGAMPDIASYYPSGAITNDNKLEAAVYCLEKAVKLQPDEQTYRMVLAEAYQEIGDIVKSNDQYLELSRKYPLDSEVWTDWAHMLLVEDNLEGAAMVIESALKYLPGNAHILYSHAAVCYLSGKQQMGRESLQEALIENYAEHAAMYKFAPQLQQMESITQLIEKFAP